MWRVGNITKAHLAVQTIRRLAVNVANWPLALLFLLAWPSLWLLSIPFRIVGVALHAGVVLISAIPLLPARLPGCRSQ